MIPEYPASADRPASTDHRLSHQQPLIDERRFSWAAATMETLAALRRRHVKALQDELLFFASFHRHPINRALHVIFVPLEWLSFLMMAKYGDLLLGLPLCALLGVSAASYYILLDPLVGLAWAPLQAAMLATVAAVWERYEAAGTWAVALAVQAVSWAVQVGVGHRLVEGNSPGMATSLTVAAVVLSPLLVWYDVAWSLGLRRELRRTVMAQLRP